MLYKRTIAVYGIKPKHFPQAKKRSINRLKGLSSSSCHAMFIHKVTNFLLEIDTLVRNNH